MASIFNADIDKFYKNISDILKLKWYTRAVRGLAFSERLFYYSFNKWCFWASLFLIKRDSKENR